MLPVSGSAGSRVKLILGESGEDYLYFFDETSGSSDWQSSGWSTGPGSLPAGLARQLNACSNKGRYITEVAHGPDGEWYVHGMKRDGSGAYAWWGGSTAADQIKEWTGTGHRLQVSFGKYGRWALVQGSNGYALSSNIMQDLATRVSRIHDAKGTVHCLRLFPQGGYFISDSEGTEWWGLCTPLSEELKHGGKDKILDVAVAGDESWVVIRPERFSSSTGVCSDIKEHLARFYREHKQRSQARAREIREHAAAQLRAAQEAAARREEERRREQELERRREAERVEREAAAQRAREEERRRAEELRRRQTEERIKERRDAEERLTEVRTKRLRVGDRVAGVGLPLSTSSEFRITRVEEDGVVHARSDNSVIVIRDPRRISLFDEPLDACFTLVLAAADKYEAAVSVFHCECHDGVCACTNLFSVRMARAVPSVSAISPRLLLEHRGEVQPFDEYMCAEKIDIRRLRKAILDLRSDTAQREQYADRLRRRLQMQGQHPTFLARLQRQLKLLGRCAVIESTAGAYDAMLRSCVDDGEGHVVHEVQYEHKDPSGRGRLFAIGKVIPDPNDKYPRTATLQGMPKELRAPLVGAFAHDIDCENSEVRLLCSLAAQLRLADLVPTLMDYRDRRAHWLALISREHDVDEPKAKRLPTIVLSGGLYSSWLRSTGAEHHGRGPNRSKAFALDLQQEMRALREQLLRHPRFKWTEVDRAKFEEGGRRGGAADAALVPRIVQSCENEVLSIIHKCFFDLGWKVRSKIFDGLIAERAGAASTLQEAMAKAEAACHQRGWDVRLAEKPLKGQQDLPMETLTEVRRLMRQEPLA